MSKQTTSNSKTVEFHAKVLTGTYHVKCSGVDQNTPCVNGNAWDLDRSLLLTPSVRMPKCPDCKVQVVYIKKCKGKFTNEKGDKVACSRNIFNPRGHYNNYCPRCHKDYISSRTIHETEDEHIAQIPSDQTEQIPADQTVTSTEMPISWAEVPNPVSNPVPTKLKFVKSTKVVPTTDCC